MEDDAIIQFMDKNKRLDCEMSWKMWAEEMESLTASFPDFSFTCDSMSCDQGVVVLHRCQAKGSHSGAPYSCGPCEPIPAEGKKVMNDPEDIYVFFREGEDKISRIVVCARGEMSGPAGIYTQLGGFPLV